MKPTSEQIKEFWEWCGFKKKLCWSDPNDIFPRHQFATWDYPDGSGSTQHLTVNPPIDLNNLFKYAVPKLRTVFFRSEKGNIAFTASSLPYVLQSWIEDITGDYEKDTLALFWAIWEVKSNELP